MPETYCKIALVVAAWLYVAFYYYYLFERVARLVKGARLLQSLLLGRYVVCRLYIIPLVSKVCHKVYFKLFLNVFAAVVFAALHNAHVYVIAAVSQFVEDDVLHDMRRFGLSEIEAGVAQTYVFKVNFVWSIYIFFALDVVAQCFLDYKGFLQVLNIFADRGGGYRGALYAFERIGKFGGVCQRGYAAGKHVQQFAYISVGK